MASVPRCRCAALDRRDNRRRPRCRAQRGAELLAVAAADPGRTARADPLAQGAGARRHVGGEPREGGGPAAYPLVDHPAQRVRPLPRARGDGEDRHLAQVRAAKQPAQVVARGARAPAEQIDLVEDDEHRRSVPRERAQIAFVQSGVGVLLRVHDPDEQVDHLDEPVHFRAMGGLDGVEVREVEQDEAVGRAGVERVA